MEIVDTGSRQSVQRTPSILSLASVLNQTQTKCNDMAHKHTHKHEHKLWMVNSELSRLKRSWIKQHFTELLPG